MIEYPQSVKVQSKSVNTVDSVINHVFFSFQQIDGEAFLLLSQADIVNIMSIKLGPALKIYNSILMFKAHCDI